MDDASFPPNPLPSAIIVTPIGISFHRDATYVPFRV
jgi:hypothetical protein